MTAKPASYFRWTGWLALFLVCVVVNSETVAANAALSGQRLKSLVQRIGPLDSILVKAQDGRVLASKNANQLRIPASVLKLLTGLGALHYLGAEYRFITEFYRSPDNQLKVKGYGDPLWVSEVLADAAATLKSTLPVNPGTPPDTTRFKGLILDDGYFQQPLPIPGRSRTPQPYDAPNSAICANFNTVHLSYDSQGRPASGEPQTPLVPFALAQLKKGGLQPGRAVLSHDERQATLYSGHLLSYFLNQQGIAVDGSITRGPVVPDKDQLLLRYASPYRLTEIIEKLMTYSNNFIANQLLLAVGAKVYNSPATLAKGQKALARFAHLELGLKGFKIVEGSGISRQNRLSAEQVMVILEGYAVRKELLRKQKRQYFKTGTLKGVQTRAGFLDLGAQGTYRFVIMINTPGKPIAPLITRLKQALAGGFRTEG